jgi:hypothetical protein
VRRRGVPGLVVVVVAATMTTQGAGTGEQEQPRWGRGEKAAPNTLDVVATTEVATTDGGKEMCKHTVECVICTDDYYTNQCPLLCGPKSSIAYWVT